MTTIGESHDLYKEYNLPSDSFLDIDSLEPTIQVEACIFEKKMGRVNGKKKRSSTERKDLGSSSSAYALFFRDMQGIIRKNRPNISFGELSKIISSEWVNLDVHKKKEYKRRTQKTKADQMRALALFKAKTLIAK